MTRTGALARARQADTALATVLNRWARRSAASAAVTRGTAEWLAGVEIVLMVALGVSGQRRRAARMLLAVGLVYAASEGLGWAWRRERPFAVLDDVVALAGHHPARSFPSRHVASGLAMALVGGGAHPRLGTAMATVAGVLGLSRVAAGLHFPSDVLGGVVLGVGIGRWLRGNP